MALAIFQLQLLAAYEFDLKGIDAIPSNSWIQKFTWGCPKWWTSSWVVAFPGYPMVANRFSFTRDHLWIKWMYLSNIPIRLSEAHTNWRFLTCDNCVKPSDIPLTRKKFREMACKLFTTKTPVCMLLCNRGKSWSFTNFTKLIDQVPLKNDLGDNCSLTHNDLIIYRFILERKSHNRDNTYTWIIWLDQHGRVSYPVDNWNRQFM